MLLIIERVLVLKSVHTFTALSDEQLMELATGMREARFASGETLMRQGDGGRSVFVIGIWGIAPASPRSRNCDRWELISIWSRGALMAASFRLRSA